MENYFGIIYKVENKVNGKVYIGQTSSTLYKRMGGHLYDVDKNRDNSIFHKALKKYDKQNFEWVILEHCDCKEEMDDMEFHYIKQYNSYRLGYNSTMGGEGMPGHKFSKETRMKMSKSRSGEKNHFYGKTHSKETRQKMVENHKGMLGKNHNIETKQLMSRNNARAMLGIKGSKNKCSKMYVITNPPGKAILIKGLAYFCEINNLTTTNMSKCATGKLNKHKNYKCRYYDSVADGSIKFDEVYI